jgi:polyketide biosynthesis enoyl-CoA hydratase PksH
MSTLETIRRREHESVGFIQIHRPEANNSINEALLEDLECALADYESRMTIVVIEGLPEVFCFGADFQQIRLSSQLGRGSVVDPERIYELWLRLAHGPCITIAHVRGKANAGGIGFVAASDIVIAQDNAQFGLSELLFGLHPACVLPFLIRKVGFQRANHLTLSTQPISAQQAHGWGLVDAIGSSSESLVRQYLLRLKRISKGAIKRYKAYIRELEPAVLSSRALAVASNREIFADVQTLAGINRFVETGAFPWEPS